MALARAVTDGFRKLTIEVRVISGGNPDVQSLMIRPILRPFSVFSVARIVGVGGEVYDLEILWQATPRIAENADQGPAVTVREDQGAGGL